MKKLLSKENKSQNILFKVKSVDTKNYIVEGVFSTEVEDRHGEIVVQNGWILENYLKNPVVLWAHKSDEPAIAKMLELAVKKSASGIDQLEGKMQFAVQEYDFAETIFNLIVGGFQNAFSAGFINNRYEIDQDNNKIYLVENELLEVSCVPVPANQLSLAKQKGIDTAKYEKHLDDDESDGGEESPSAEDLENLESEGDDLNESKAIEKISKSNVETIRGAISTLTEVLKAHEADKAKAEVSKEVEHPANVGGKNKVSVKLLNKAIRELLGVKKSL